MQTTRIGPLDFLSPATRFWMGADWISQNGAGNYSTLRTTITAAVGPTGSTGSFSGGYGIQYAWGPYGWLQYHEGNPFLPSGYAANQTRWDEYADHTFYHDANGYLSGGVAFGMHIEYSGVAGDWYGSIGAPSRIPKKPSVPGNPTFSNITPTSATVSWTASADNGGSSIDGYLLRRRETPNGSYVNLTQENNTSRSVVLTPGKTYYYSVYAHNGSQDNGGYSDQTSQMPVSALSGAYVSDGTSWVPTAVFESDGTNWNARVIQVSDGSAWDDAL